VGKIVGFQSQNDIRRVVKAVKKSETPDISDRAGGRWDTSNQCIVAKLTTQGSAHWTYGFTQQQFSGLDWADLPSGLTGTPTSNPAIDPSLDPSSNLTGKVVVLVRSAAADGLCWVVGGAVGTSDCTSESSTSFDVVTGVTWNAGGNDKLQYTKVTVTIDGCGNASTSGATTVDIDTAGSCS
jgi:hypothetical protein